MRLIHGDLFDVLDQTDGPVVLGHGVNAEGIMGAGIAAQFRVRYPEMYNNYANLCKDGSLRPGDSWIWHEDVDRVHIANLVTQDKSGPNAAYRWVGQSLRAVAAWAEQECIPEIHIPKIGCGIGGLDWEGVAEEIASVEDIFNVEVVVWSL